MRADLFERRRGSEGAFCKWTTQARIAPPDHGGSGGSDQRGQGGWERIVRRSDQNQGRRESRALQALAAEVLALAGVAHALVLHASALGRRRAVGLPAPLATLAMLRLDLHQTHHFSKIRRGTTDPENQPHGGPEREPRSSVSNERNDYARFRPLNARRTEALIGLALKLLPRFECLSRRTRERASGPSRDPVIQDLTIGQRWGLHRPRCVDSGDSEPRRLFQRINLTRVYAMNIVAFTFLPKSQSHDGWNSCESDKRARS